MKQLCARWLPTVPLGGGAATALALLLVVSPSGVTGGPQTEEQLQPLPVTQLDELQRTLDLEGRTFSLRFSEPVPILDILLLLVRETSFSIVPDPDVSGTFIGELKAVTLRETLDLVLHPLGLDYSVQGSFIRVFREQMETRLFDLNYVITRRSGQRTLATATGTTGDATTGSSQRVTSAESPDIFQEIATGVQTLLSGQGRFNLDRRAALLQVTDFVDRLEKLNLYIEAVESRANRQVQIQARVIEVELRDQFAAGIDWTQVLRSTGQGATVTQTPARPAGGAVVLGLELRDFPGLFRALETQGTVNVLSNPGVVALNNEPAVMRVGTQDIIFVPTWQFDTTGRVLQTTMTPQAVTEGIVLSLTPQIGDDGVISMSITPSISQRTGQATSRFGDVVPILSVREADTLVRVRQGETIVLAGLMQDRTRRQTSRRLGLFRRETISVVKTELVVLLTPTLVPSRPASETAREGERFD